MPDQEPFETGTVIDRYKIERKLGEGGSANAYLVTDTIALKPAAIKVLKNDYRFDRAARTRLKREFEVVTLLDHDRFVPIYSFVPDSEFPPYIIMEYMAGESLKAILEEKDSFSVKEAAGILNPIVLPLHWLHTNQIIHRDLKPSNILFDKDGIPHLADFSLVKYLTPNDDEHTITSLNDIPGTVAYMSPEQTNGEELDARSDVYSLGIILYQMLTGERPFTAENTWQMMYMHRRAILPDVNVVKAALPARCNDIIQKACAKNREDRYESAIALATAFAEIAGVEPPLEPKDVPGFAHITYDPDDVQPDEEFDQQLRAWFDKTAIRQTVGYSSNLNWLEDRAHYLLVKTKEDLSFFLAIVTDGNNRNEHSRQASQMALDGIHRNIVSSQAEEASDIPEMLQSVFEKTGDMICRYFRDTEWRGKITASATAIVIHEDCLYVAHVGTCRLYVVRGGRSSHIEQLTLNNDERLGAELPLTVDLNLHHRAASDNNDVQSLALEITDHILLCTDGLLPGQAIKERDLQKLARENHAEDMARLLMEKAKDKEVQDNASVIVIQPPESKPVIPIIVRFGWILRLFAFFVASSSAFLIIATLSILLYRSPAFPDIPIFPTSVPSPTTKAAAGIESTSTPIFVPSASQGNALILEAGENAQAKQKNWGWATIGENAEISLNEGSEVKAGDTRMRLSLDDGTHLIFSQNDHWGLFGVVDDEIDEGEKELSIRQSKALIHRPGKLADSDDSLNILSIESFPDIIVQSVMSDTLMGIIYDGETGHEELYCFKGECLLVNRDGDSIDLSANQYVEIKDRDDQAIDGPKNITNAIYEEFCELEEGLILIAECNPALTSTSILAEPELITSTLTPLASTETTFTTTVSNILTPEASSTNTPRLTSTSTIAPRSTATSDVIPTATSLKTGTPEPPTDTPEPPNDTPEPPTDTPEPPTDTPEPPTDTPKPPTDTPKPPAPTLTPRTTMTPVESETRITMDTPTPVTPDPSH